MRTGQGTQILAAKQLSSLYSPPKAPHPQWPVPMTVSLPATNENAAKAFSSSRLMMDPFSWSNRSRKVLLEIAYHRMNLLTLPNADPIQGLASMARMRLSAQFALSVHGPR